MNPFESLNTKTTIVNKLDELRSEERNLIKIIEDKKRSMVEEKDDLTLEQAQERDAAIEATKTELETVRSNIVLGEQKLAKHNSTMNDMGVSERSDSFLSTEASVRAFAEVIKRARSSEDYITMWSEELNQRGVTWTGGVPIPTEISQKIEDTIKRVGTIYSLVSKDWTGKKKVFLFEKNGELGHGDNRSDKSSDKQEQSLVFDKLEVECGFVYKFVELDRVDIKTVEGIIDYVNNELPTRLIKTIEKAIMLRSGQPTDETYISSIQPISGAGGDFVTEIIADDLNEDTLDDMWAEIDQEGQIFLVGSKKDYIALKKVKNSLGVPVYKTDTTTINGIGYKTIDGYPFIDVDYISTTAAAVPGNYSLVMAVLGSYTLIGDSNMAFYKESTSKKNKEQFMVEQWIGGAPTGLKMASVIKKGTPVVLTEAQRAMKEAEVLKKKAAEAAKLANEEAKVAAEAAKLADKEAKAAEKLAKEAVAAEAAETDGQQDDK